MSESRIRFWGRLETMRIEDGYDPVGFVSIPEDAASQICAHELARRLELGKRRGFGSVKVTARVGRSEWQTSVFPQKSGGWFLPIKKAVRLAERLEEGSQVWLELELH